MLYTIQNLLENTKIIFNYILPSYIIIQSDIV